MGIEHYIEFGGVKSSDYGIHVSGEGVFKAPERDVEHIEIPGRNGEFLLDKGRFKNIEVPYRVFNKEATYEEFISRIDAFRNAIVSKWGYQRLEDSFHPDEYRMASISQGMDVDPIQFAKASEFEVVFDCKPQRFLKSGETEQTVSSGDTITNPTLFESNPLLKVDGYGAININDDVISIQQGATIGDIILSTSKTETNQNVVSVPLNKSYIAGDVITVASNAEATVQFKYRSGYTLESIERRSGDDFVEFEVHRRSNLFEITVRRLDTPSFIAGTSSTSEATVELRATLKIGDTTQTTNITMHLNYEYVAGETDKIRLNGYGGLTISGGIASRSTYSVTIPEISAYSTKSAIGNLYIDLDIGEAYQIIDGSYVPINYAVTMPADLPTLKPGANDITFDNTITDLKITPRWWRI